MSNEGRLVKVAYRGFFDDGFTFIDQTEQPIEFPCLDGWMPPEFIETVRDMAVGETRLARAGADVAYEDRRDDRIMEMPLDRIPSDARLVVGEIVSLEGVDGRVCPARLIELSNTHAVFDFNHDAVCKALNFEITLLEAHDMPPRGRLQTCGNLEQVCPADENDENTQVD
ncbi:peptidylprolyl isomerase [Paraeggerthella sp. Marseille-Q4926]|uniref:FKBP-type peptidyl-prolyl cis-trans isomerase n=1 Tax=Paraeggerthella TaxID=651554 RepID=UPI001CE4526A|nr:FKBP-type peptidyl-prolyl cis-trans isomerase [Paraeggerthella sp. Marseille-Q4926]